MSKKLTTEEFISKANKIHNFVYNYDKTKYAGANKKVIITCLKHGDFLQEPHNHTHNKQGCMMCGRNETMKYVKSNLQKFIKKANKIHNNKYDYSLSKYKKCDIKTIIICKKHGKFRQMPESHLSGNGCPKCTNRISKPEVEFLNYLNINRRNYTIPEWKKKHVDGYDEKTNTIYEFLGDYYHGNPDKYNLNDINPTCKKLFGTLYEDTLSGFYKLKKLGYNIKYIWERDWKKFQNKDVKVPNIQEYKFMENKLC